MRIAIQTLGTRGDVQPYVALGRGLRDAGHEVVLATDARFERMATGQGLGFAPLPGALLDLIGTPEGRQAVAGGMRARLALLGEVRPLLRGLLEAQWSAAEGVHAILYHPKAVGAPSIAERLGIPALLAFTLPAMTPTRAFPSPLLPVRDLGPLNAASHRIASGLGEALFRGALARWRRELGLAGRSAPGPAARLYGVSPAVVPRPPDWGPDSQLTGYWFLEQAAERGLDPDLQAFLAAGPAPVYVGFGSIPSVDPERTATLVAEALRLSGRRGIVATGGGGLAPTSAEHVHVIQEAPHDRLFPLVAAVVHHGGAGTTAAGLRAGRPTVICPFFGDQPFWGHRVATLGAGPEPIPQRRLTAQGLAAAIRQATSDPEMARRAGMIGAAIRAEDGVGRAVEAIEEAVAAWPRR